MWFGRGRFNSWIDCSSSATRSDGHLAALMAPAWQNMSNRSLILRSASMISIGSGFSSNRKPAKANGTIRAVSRSNVNVVATARSREWPGGGRSASSSSARLSGASMALFPAFCDVIQKAGYHRPTEVETARSGCSSPLAHEPVVGKPRLAAFLMDLPLTDQISSGLIPC